jgi:hypothetical protein
MSEEFLEIVETSFDKAMKPVWIYTEDYIYGLVPADDEGKRWTEVVYTPAEDDPLRKGEKSASFAYQLLFEELTKGLPYYVKDFKVVDFKQFDSKIEGKSGPEKMKAVVEELIQNSAKYSEHLQIVKNKDGLDVLKEKV